MKSKKRAKIGYGQGVFSLDVDGVPVDRRKGERRKHKEIVAGGRYVLTNDR